MPVIIHKTRPDWAKPLGTIIFVPFKMNKTTTQERTQSPNFLKKVDKQDKAADEKRSSVISEEAHRE